MSRCIGDITQGTRVDAQMDAFIDGETSRLGVSRSEFHRRLLELYRDSRREQVDCPHCESPVMMDLKEE